LMAQLPPIAQLSRHRHIPVRPADLRRLHHMLCLSIGLGLLNLLLALCILWL
jgi:hypothetical protein